jgi:hypothetical protein
MPPAEYQRLLQESQSNNVLSSERAQPLRPHTYYGDGPFDPPSSGEDDDDDDEELLQKSPPTPGSTERGGRAFADPLRSGPGLADLNVGPIDSSLFAEYSYTNAHCSMITEETAVFEILDIRSRFLGVSSCRNWPDSSHHIFWVYRKFSGLSKDDFGTCLQWYIQARITESPLGPRR